jgi:transposase InsO family protein
MIKGRITRIWTSPHLASPASLPVQASRRGRRYLRAAVAYYASLGVTVERVMTDNGSRYKSFAFRKACKRLRRKHIRTKPYTPKTNGKAERFIQTSFCEWAYAQAYNTSKDRAAELPRWLHRYNWHRPHGSQSRPSADSAWPGTTS